MDPDDAADLLDALLEANQPAASAIIHALPSELSTELQSLLSYEEDTAGALMTSQFVSIPEELSIEEALAEYKTQGDISEDAAHSIFIVTKDGRLVGYTDLRALVLGEPKTPVKDIRNEYPVHIDANTNEEDVARMMKKYDILVAPVVDSQKRLLGVITVDDVVDVMVEAATEDFYKLSGTTDIQESTLLFGRIYSAVFTRLPWLFMTVVGGMVAAFIMSTYSEDFHLSSISLGLTLSFVPLLMGLGGNIGNQSATIIVRGISTGETQRRSAGYFIGREIWVASMIGAVLALCVGLVLLLLGNNPLLSLIIASSIVLNSMIAAGLGSMLPIFFQKINIDPAVASAPFISSTLDIISQIVYFVLTISLFTLWPAP